MSIVEYYGDSSPQGIIKYWEKKTKWECAREVLRCWNKIEEMEINKLLPQDVEEFIAEHILSCEYDEYASRIPVIHVDYVRKFFNDWMSVHVRVPVELLEDAARYQCIKNNVGEKLTDKGL